MLPETQCNEALVVKGATDFSIAAIMGRQTVCIDSPEKSSSKSRCSELPHRSRMLPTRQIVDTFLVFHSANQKHRIEPKSRNKEEQNIRAANATYEIIADGKLFSLPKRRLWFLFARMCQPTSVYLSFGKSFYENRLDRKQEFFCILTRVSSGSEFVHVKLFRTQIRKKKLAFQIFCFVFLHWYRFNVVKFERNSVRSHPNRSPFIQF